MAQNGEFDHPQLVWILVIANIPLYIWFGRIFFDGFKGFFASLRGVSRVEGYSVRNEYQYQRSEPTDEEVDGFWAALRLLPFLMLSLACLGAEYHLIVWLLFG
jgi:hypothetical protein